MRRKYRRTLAAVFLSVSLAAVLGGCSQKPAETAAVETAGEAAGTEADSAGAGTTGGENAGAGKSEAENAGTDMAEPEESTCEIVDMAGRTVTLPRVVDKIFPTNPVSAIYLYTMDPGWLVGWNYELNEMEKSIILPEYHDLPVFGQNDKINNEAVIAAGPSFVLMADADNDAARESADLLSESLGIPVVMISEKLEDTAEVYRFLEQILGDARGDELPRYVDAALKEAEALSIPEEERVTVYLGNGEDSLETPPAGSPHGQIAELAGGVNVAVVEGGDRVRISLEQLLSWNPDYILVNGEPKKDMTGKAAAEKILANPDLATLTAVQNGNVYGVPNIPFSWVDRPPGPNRIIGIRWLSKVFYPELCDYDLYEEIRYFYDLFYHVGLTDEQISGFLGL